MQSLLTLLSGLLIVCLLLVVVSHTMMVSPVLHPDGTVTSENTLGNQDWFEPVIWIFMVMPLFFVAGGITGIQAWRRLRNRGGTGIEFAQARLLRLIRPAAALLPGGVDVAAVPREHSHAGLHVETLGRAANVFGYASVPFHEQNLGSPP